MRIGLVTGLTAYRRLAGEAPPPGPDPDPYPNPDPDPEIVMASGMNYPSNSYYSIEFPFTDLMRKCNTWRAENVNGEGYFDHPMPPMDEHGWPMEMPSGGSTFLDLIVTNHYDEAVLGNTLRITFDGDDSTTDERWAGNLRMTWPCQTNRVGPNEYIVTTNGATALTLRIDWLNPADHIRNIKIELAEVGEFRQAFIDRQEGMRVMRFMDWMNTNLSPIVEFEEWPTEDDFPSVGGYNRVPIAIMCRASNAAGVPPWFCIPHLASDDFVEKFAYEVAENIDPTLPIYIEYSNECWNATMYEQYNYCIAQGNALGLPGEDQWRRAAQFYGMRARQIEEIIRPIFGSRLKMVFAWQAVNPSIADAGLSYGDTAEHMDVLAIAPYFGTSLGDFDYPTAEDSYSIRVKNQGLPYVFSFISENIEGVLRDNVQIWVGMAEQYGCEIACYEAGQHLVGNGPANDDLVLRQIFFEANRDPRMGDAYRQFAAMWAEETPDDSIVAWYNSMWEPTASGDWGAMRNEADVDAVKWVAIQGLVDHTAVSYPSFPPFPERPNSTSPMPEPEPEPGPGIGDVEFGATGAQGSIYEGYRMVDGDDFDDTTSADFVSPANGAGRYMTTRHYGVQSGAPRYLRGAASLGGYEADPWHTGYADANRGQVPASYADLITFGDGALRTKTRRATGFERTIMGALAGKNNLSAMVHMGRRNMMRAPCVMEMRLRFPHALPSWNQYHPTFWLLQSQPGNGWDGLEIDCEGFTPELGLYRNTWNAGTLVNTGQLGSTQAVSQTEYRTYTFKVAQDGQGVWMMYLYEDGVLRGSGTCSSGSFVFDPTRPFHLMQTSHILQNGLNQSIFDAAGDTGATMDCDFWRVWQPTGAVFREPLVDHQEFFADFGANFSLALATPQEVWGPDVTTDVIENIPHEDTTPGAPWQRGLLPAGVTRTGNTINGRFNDRPGRLIMARSATPAAGDGCIPQTITLNIGPQIRASTIQYQVGVAGSFDLYAACDCGDLFIGKVITVTGLPAWASYSAATGLISWTNPPDAGTIAFSVSVTNSQGQSATASVSLVRQVVITGFVYDSFTDANGTRLGDHVGEDGVAWYAPGNISGNGGIINNDRASPMTNNVMIYRKQITPPSNDYEVTATFDKLTTISGESSGILLRNSGEGEQGYLVRTNGSQWGILRMTATGVATSLGTYNDIFANGTSRTIRFRVVGNVLTLYINNVAVLTVTDTTNAFPSGRVGVRMIPPRTATTGIHITHIEAQAVVA